MNEQTRQKMKRQLLDGLDKIYQFDLPETMLEEEFATVWRQLTADMTRSGQSFGEGEEEKTREEYRAIAARRVRLGLVLWPKSVPRRSSRSKRTKCAMP